MKSSLKVAVLSLTFLAGVYLGINYDDFGDFMTDLFSYEKSKIDPEADLKQLEADIAEKDKWIVGLRTELSKQLIWTNRKNQELAQLQNDVEDLEKSVQAKQSDLKRLQKYVKKQNSELDLLSRQFAQLASQIESLRFVRNTENKFLKSAIGTYSVETFNSDTVLIGKHPDSSGSAYLEFDQGNLFLVSATGQIAYVNSAKLTGERFEMTTIPSNILDIISYPEFFRTSEYGIKDTLILDDKIFVSFSNQVSDRCFNTSILVSELNLEQLHFSEFFVPENCVGLNNDYGEFNPHQAGGRLFPFLENQILFSTGEYKYRDHAQDRKNYFGKIVAIDVDTSEARIVSMGHRNPQGLFYDRKRNIIVSSEHGPLGGDELNVDSYADSEIANFGWPISSYGEHYGFTHRDDDHPIYKKAPLHKSHSEYGFVEPVTFFTPSIAVSEVVGVPFEFGGTEKLQLWMGSMGQDLEEGDRSIHVFVLGDDYKIEQSSVLPVDERIRDMLYVEELNKLFIFMETSASIGVISTD